MLLTVEYNDAGVVEVFMDEEGRNFLIEALSKLRTQGGKGDHDHLMTPSWAGYELTEEKQGAENKLVNKLNIVLLPN